MANPPEAGAYTGCVTRDTKGAILHCFPAHLTDLQQVHRDELDSIANRVRTGDMTGQRIRRIRITGHAATWRGLSADDYTARSKARALAARDYLRVQLNGMGLSYRPRIDVAWRGDSDPLVDNAVSSTSAAARRNREINRRVEITWSGPRGKVTPTTPDDPLPTDWNAFLQSKLRQLKDHWAVQRPFAAGDLGHCVLTRLQLADAGTRVVEPMGAVGALPADNPIRWTDLREDLISDLKKGYARGAIRTFEGRFDLHVDNMITAVRQLGFRATGSDIYERKVTSAWRKVKRLSLDEKHLYGCEAVRDHIAKVEDPSPF